MRNIKPLREIFGEGWWNVLGEEFNKPYMQNIGKLISANMETIEPKGGVEAIFRAYTLCPYEKVRVVIIGQD